MLLASLQALEMAQVQGSIRRLLPAERQTLHRLHRGGGITALFLMALVAAACVVGEGFRFHSLRGGIHAVAGSLAMLFLPAKIVITHRVCRLLRLDKALGGAAGALILVTFAASVGWYLQFVVARTSVGTNYPPENRRTVVCYAQNSTAEVLRRAQ